MFTWDIAGGLPVVLDDGSQYVYGLGLLAQVTPTRPTTTSPMALARG
jgi:hypothetical protein